MKDFLKSHFEIEIYMKIAAIADIHGQLPPDIECDLLLIGGDITPTRWGVSMEEKVWTQREWLQNQLSPWLKRQKIKKTVATFGNHDWIGLTRHMLPEMPWTVLVDESTEFMGMKIYGSPWQRPFYDWAFNLPEKDLVPIWERIPPDTDILLLHSPPFGHCDLVDGDNAGSPSLTERIKIIKPKLVVCGHIHCARGISHIGETIIANAAMVNYEYVLDKEPMVFEL